MAFCPMCGANMGTALGNACLQCSHIVSDTPGEAVVELTKRRREPILVVRGLHVDRPDGAPLLSNVNLTLHAGEVIVLLGPSGAGKTTLGRVFLEPDNLRAAGFQIESDDVDVRGPLGFVPQRGALFDHLDIAGNIRLAIRYNDDRSGEDDVVEWLRRVDLDEELALPGASVAHLSGGQAQRVAVARTLAGGRRVLFLDEPSIGLDSSRVRLLARQVRHQVESCSAGAIVVTHDLAFAIGVADRILLLDPIQRTFVPLFEGEYPGPFDKAGSAHQPGARGLWQARLEEELVRRLNVDDRNRVRASRRSSRGVLRVSAQNLARPFSVAGSVLVDGIRQFVHRPLEFIAIYARVVRQALLRPLLFYAVVSILLGYTVLYVIAGVAPAGVRPEKAVALLGSSHVVALVPPVGAFLFVAASGNAVNGWLGGMSLTRQIAALEALGIDSRRYLWGPCFAGLVTASLVISAVLTFGMVIGGVWFCSTHGVVDGWNLITRTSRIHAPNASPISHEPWCWCSSTRWASEVTLWRQARATWPSPIKSPGR